MTIFDSALVMLALASQPVEADAHAPLRTADPLVSAPRRSGKWLVITGGALTASLTITRLALSIVILHNGLCYRKLDEDSSACEEDWSPLYAKFADGMAPAFVISLGLLGGGLSWMGRWRAHEDLSRRRSSRRNHKLRARVGWALLGTGVAVWATSVGVGWHCEEALRNTPCFLGVHEGLFWGGAALVGAGIGLAPFAHGYDRQSRATAPSVRWTPAVGPGYAGFSLAGQF